MMRDTFVKTLLEIAKKDSNVHILTGDLGFGVLKPFWEQLPDQITNVGIAEQNMTGFATGMALEGKTVFTYSIGNFPTLRTLEQIRNDASYHDANVKIVSVGGGFAYGALGMSHHATEDIAIMRALPNVSVIAPGDLIETAIATKYIYRKKGVCYLRLGRGGEKQVHTKQDLISINNPTRIFKGTKIAIMVTGSILSLVSDVCKDLASEGIHVSLFSVPVIKPISLRFLSEVINEYNTIITVEEHNKVGGFGSAVLEGISDITDKNISIIRLGIDDKYMKVVGNQDYLRKESKIDYLSIYNTIKNKFKKNDPSEKL